MDETGRCLLFAILVSLWSLGRGRLIPFVLGCGCVCGAVIPFASVASSAGGCCRPPIPAAVGVAVVVVMVVVVAVAVAAVVIVASGRAEVVESVVVGAVVAVVTAVAVVATAAAAAMALSSEGTGAVAAAAATATDAPVRGTTSTLDISTLFPIARPVSSDRFCCSVWLGHSESVP